ncbi:MAG: aquaporin family protein, partial [Bacteroidales bacterium]|nr:aquaporin family protein [Bacteroidales bacterium]
MNPYIAEFIGTLVLVLLGDGVCAACSLNHSKAKGAGWVVIALGWGLAVMMGVLIAGPSSGAHLNPAVTLGLAVAGKFAWKMVLGYIVAQMLGGFFGAALVWIFYKDHYKA